MYTIHGGGEEGEEAREAGGERGKEALRIETPSIGLLPQSPSLSTS